MSSEEPMDTSDEIEKLPNEINSTENVINQFITGIVTAAASQQQEYLDDGEQAHCSRDTTGTRASSHSGRSQAHIPRSQPVPVQLTKAEQMIRDAEMLRARILEVPGENENSNLKK